MLGSVDNPDTKHWCTWPHPSRTNSAANRAALRRFCPPLQPPPARRGALSSLPSVLRGAGWLTAGVGKIFHYRENAEEYTLPYNDHSAPLLRKMCHQEHANQNSVACANETTQYCACTLLAGNTWPDEKIASTAIGFLQRFEQMGAPQTPFLLLAGFLRPHVPSHAPLRSLAIADAVGEELLVSAGSDAPPMDPCTGDITLSCSRTAMTTRTVEQRNHGQWIQKDLSMCE